MLRDRKVALSFLIYLVKTRPFLFALEKTCIGFVLIKYWNANYVFTKLLLALFLNNTKISSKFCCMLFIF